MEYRKPNYFCYRLAQVICWFVATFVFRRRILRSEIRGKKGPFVVIANHQAAYDFVNLIGIAARPMSFVISNSFYNSLPITGFFDMLGVIPKQQFQTTPKDMRRMKRVVEHGQPLVIYPAGLMCEDGLSTPIPDATYKFLKWLDADVYVARTAGTYFAMPKWSKGFRPGRTDLDVYKLFDRQQLAAASLEEVEQAVNTALLYDAYREQEELQITYANNHNIEGLEQVLYMCPHCLSEFSMAVKQQNTIYCKKCGYELQSDRYAFLHNRRGIGPALRYVSDWSRLIYHQLKEKLQQDDKAQLTANTAIHMINYEKHRFEEVGNGTVSLSRSGFVLSGSINGQPAELNIPIANIPSLPFSPGKYFEIQQGSNIYRCRLEDGRLVMKFINMVKIFYELNGRREKRKTAAQTQEVLQA